MDGKIFVGALLPPGQAAALFQFLAMVRKAPTLARGVLTGGDGLPPEVAAQLPGGALPDEAADGLIKFAVGLDLMVWRDVPEEVLADGRLSFDAELRRMLGGGLNL